MFVPGSETETSGDQDFSVRGTLYCIPVENRGSCYTDWDTCAVAPHFYGKPVWKHFSRKIEITVLKNIKCSEYQCNSSDNFYGLERTWPEMR